MRRKNITIDTQRVKTLYQYLMEQNGCSEETQLFLNESYFQWINESLSVSDDIQQIQNNVKSRIVQNGLKIYNDGTGKSILGEYYISQSSFSIEIDGEKIAVDGTLFIFANERQCFSMTNGELITHNHWDINTSTIHAEIWYALDKKKTIEPRGALIHEITHAFQDIKGAHSKGLSIDDFQNDKRKQKSFKLYQDARTYLSTQNIGPLYYYIAQVLYYSNKRELDAFTHGMFEIIKSTPPRELENRIKKDEMVDTVAKIIYNGKNIEKYNGTKELNDALNYFHITYEQLLKFIHDIEVGYTRGISRAYSKTQEGKYGDIKPIKLYPTPPQD